MVRKSRKKKAGKIKRRRRGSRPPPIYGSWDELKGGKLSKAQKAGLAALGFLGAKSAFDRYNYQAPPTPQLLGFEEGFPSSHSDYYQPLQVRLRGGKLSTAQKVALGTGAVLGTAGLAAATGGLSLLPEVAAFGGEGVVAGLASYLPSAAAVSDAAMSGAASMGSAAMAMGSQLGMQRLMSDPSPPTYGTEMYHSEREPYLSKESPFFNRGDPTQMRTPQYYVNQGAQQPPFDMYNRKPF